jgi:hypothetical protein
MGAKAPMVYGRAKRVASAEGGALTVWGAARNPGPRMLAN